MSSMSPVPVPVPVYTNGATSPAVIPDLDPIVTAPASPPAVFELDAGTIRNAMWRHIITLQWSWNYERMQGLGYCFSMLPVINKVYTTREERIAAMKRHLVFYNTNTVCSPAIFGATVALEAQRQGEVVDSLKVGLMGPMAGIGDTVQGILFRPIIAVLAASLALAGSGLGPLLLVASGIFWTFIQVPIFHFGYRRGIGVAQEVAEGGMVARITELATVVGMIVVGGFIPSILGKVQTPLEFASNQSVNGETHAVQVPVQATLDQLLPFMLPVLFVALAYWLMRRFKFPAVWVLVVLTVVGFVLGAAGVL